jgi:hypothetical protein
MVDDLFAILDDERALHAERREDPLPRKRGPRSPRHLFASLAVSRPSPSTAFAARIRCTVDAAQ